MKIKFNPLNNRGSVLVQSMVVMGVSMMSIIAAQQLAQVSIDSTVMQKASLERERMLSSLKVIMNDQRVCGLLFDSSNFNGVAAGVDYDFDRIRNAAAPTIAEKVKPDFAKEVLSKVESSASFYRAGRVRLSNPVNLPADLTGVSYKRFDFMMTVTPDTAKLGAGNDNPFIEGVTGINKDSSDSRNLNMVFGSNGRCYLEGSDDVANTNLGVAAACDTMNGNLENSRCMIKKYTEKPEGVINVTQTEQSSAVFGDVLCRMELAALQKMGRHMVDSGPGGLAYGWTSLCAKPKWAGCRAGNHNAANGYGNDESSSNLKLPGEQWKYEHVTHIDSLRQLMQDIMSPSLDRRLNRVAGVIMNEDYRYISNRTLGSIPYMAYTDSYLDKLLGLSQAFGIAMGGGTVVGGLLGFGGLASMFMAGPVMLGIVAILALFLPSCNKGKAEATTQCVEGFPEVTRIDYYNQRLKIKLFGWRCNWRHRGFVKIPSDADIYLMYRSQPVQPNTITDTSGAEDNMSALISDINATTTFDELVDLFLATFSDPTAPADPDQPDVARAIPQELIDVVTAKELAYWQTFYNSIDTELTTVATGLSQRLTQDNALTDVDACTIDNTLPDCGGPNDICVVTQNSINAFNAAEAAKVAASIANSDEVRYVAQTSSLTLPVACDGVKPANVNTCLSLPANSAGCESGTAYLTRVEDHLNSSRGKLENIALRAKKYYDFSINVTNADGTRRDVTTTQVYTLYILPIKTKISTAHDNMMDAAVALELSIPPITAPGIID